MIINGMRSVSYTSGGMKIQIDLIVGIRHLALYESEISDRSTTGIALSHLNQVILKDSEEPYVPHFLLVILLEFLTISIKVFV